MKSIFCVFFVCLLPLGSVFAQTITLTSPLVNMEVNEGDDFATQVLRNPWDFDERRDIGWEEKYVGSSVGTSFGIWSGTYDGSTPGKSYVFPLFPGFANTSVHTSGVEGDRAVPSLGAQYPIDSSKYYLLSYMGSHDRKELEFIYWNTDPTGGNTQGISPEAFWPDASQLCGKTNEVALVRGAPVSGWQARHFDLSNLAGECDVQDVGAWTGNVIALRVDSSITEVSGNVTRFDWMRLVDPTSAPDLTITWTDTGITGAHIVSVYIDDNAASFDGREYMNADGNPGSITFPTAALPPGDWYFYLVVRDKSTLTVQSTSAYSARLRVNQAPLVTFAAPTQVTGQDFATRELGDPWDFATMSDAANVGTSVVPYNTYDWKQFFGESVASGALVAFADDPLAGNTETDAQVHFNLGNSLSDVGGVDSGAYRYFAFDLFIDPTLYPTISDKVANGFVSRVVSWQNLDEFDQRFAPKHNIIFEGMNRYYIDLHDFDVAEKNVFPASSAWLEKEIWSHLRFDPQETGVEGPTQFSLDNVNLYTENFSEDQEYTIAWDIEDDDANVNISIYYDADNQDFNGTLIATLNNVASGAGSYDWDTSSFTEGTSYYVYLEIDDGVNTSRFYSPVPIIIGPPAVNSSLVLNSPLYSLWNSFLGMTNILELVNKGTDPLTLNLTFYRLDGSVWYSEALVLGPTGQLDRILNDFPNYPENSYGVVKIEFAGDKLDGRMSFYRSNPAGAGIGDNFEFAFNEPFVNPLTGNSYVSFNTFQPSLNAADISNPVRNFLSIVNLHPTDAKSFTIRRYNQSGSLVSEIVRNVPAFGRQDVDGGHGDGPSLVGYNEIIPNDPTSPYKASLIRYGSADPFGLNYDFAFNLKAVNERADQQWVNIAKTNGSQNWLEIVNTSNSSVNAEVRIFNYDGTQLHLVNYNLGPRAQVHLEVGSFLSDAQPYGAVRILASASDAIIAQSMFYARDDTGSVRAMYGYQAERLNAGEQSSSWNLFLGMSNDLHFFNASTTKTASVRLMVGNGSKEKERTYSLSPRTGVAVNLAENLDYGTVANNYGVVRLHGRFLLANSVRIKPDAVGSHDFITPVDVRP